MVKKGPKHRKKSITKRKEQRKSFIEKSCKGKTRYQERHIAHREAKRFLMTYYSCNFCGGWHLTRNGKLGRL